MIHHNRQESNQSENLEQTIRPTLRLIPQDQSQGQVTRLSHPAPHHLRIPPANRHPERRACLTWDREIRQQEDPLRDLLLEDLRRIYHNSQILNDSIQTSESSSKSTSQSKLTEEESMPSSHSSTTHLELSHLQGMTVSTSPSQQTNHSPIYEELVLVDPQTQWSDLDLPHLSTLEVDPYLLSGEEDSQGNPDLTGWLLDLELEAQEEFPPVTVEPPHIYEELQPPGLLRLLRRNQPFLDPQKADFLQRPHQNPRLPPQAPTE